MQNLPRKQGIQGFNSDALSIISQEAIEELIVNVLVHRDYFVPAAVRVF